MTHSPNDIARPKYSPWPGVIVIAVTAIVMANLCRADFSGWDDWGTIHQNGWLNPPTLASVKHYWSSAELGLYIPVTYSVWIVLAIVARLHQAGPDLVSLNPWIFHVANLLVHLFTAWAVYRLLRRLVGRAWPACFGALLFAIHPVQVESVGWCSGMKDLLAGCFGVLALWRYVTVAQRSAARSELPNTGWKPVPRLSFDALGFIALLLAILSKPSAAMIPLIAVVIDRLIVGRAFREIARNSWSWFIGMIVALFVARLAQHTEGVARAPLWARPLIVGDTITFYLRQLIYPVPLGIDYGRAPLVVLQSGWTFVVWIVPLTIAWLMWRSRRRRPWLLASGLVFVAAILPVSGLATFQFQFTSTTADHYLYTAMLGPAIAGAFLVDRYRRSGKRLIVGGTTLIIVLLSARAFMQTFAWQDDIALFGNALEVNPTSFIAHNNLGNAYMKLPNHGAAIEEFRAAIASNPSYPDAWRNLASEQLETGDVNGAITNLREAVRLRALLPSQDNPTAAADHAQLAEMLLFAGKDEAARNEIKIAQNISANDPEVKIALARLRDREAATATRPTSQP